jgi:quinol monooxygenase YgiN
MKACPRMKPAIAVIGMLRFPPDRLGEVRPFLQQLVSQTHQNDGCIAYDVAEDPFDPGVIRFSELWPDRPSLDRHLKAPHIEPWRQAAQGCGLSERRFTAYEIGGLKPV